jgi:hypothetical protein
MITARLLTVLAASSLAGIAYAQTQPAPSPQPSAPPGYNAAHPHQREMRTVPGNERAQPNSRSAPGSALNTPQTGSMAGPRSATAPGSSLTSPASSQRNHAEGMRMAEAGPGGVSWTQVRVRTPSGQSLGKVTRVVPGLNGKKWSGYVLVATPGNANGMSTPVPYPMASHMVRHGALVVPKKRFEHAPKVTQEALANRSDKAWRLKADRYWKQAGHARTRRSMK